MPKSYITKVHRKLVKRKCIRAFENLNYFHGDGLNSNSFPVNTLIRKGRGCCLGNKSIKNVFDKTGMV